MIVDHDSNFLKDDVLKLAKLSVPIPRNELKRLKLLRESKILDKDNTREEQLDRITSLAKRVFNVRFKVCEYYVFQ